MVWSFWGTQGREKFKGKVAVMALKAIVAHLPANIRVGLEVLRTVTRLQSHEASQHTAWVTCGPCLWSHGVMSIVGRAALAITGL